MMTTDTTVDRQEERPSRPEDKRPKFWQRVAVTPTAAIVSIVVAAIVGLSLWTTRTNLR